MYGFHRFQAVRLFIWVVEALLDEQFELFVSHDILLEYEEKLKEHYSISVAENFLRSLKELPNVQQVEVFFKWQTLDATDPDDNKFVDAAFSANVHYLVSDDKHYHPLQNRDFPVINCIKLEAFKKLLNL
ncbi:MAG: putative toxin-antitoxin system toxin component, PIN family [Saprospiraceae bacterium]|nr:putative toxin-antitoxin system toxin component, PIN family [Saprospiraceae bacterium]